jgi:mannose-1-phosphate guanylyltransferase/mannose-6-phosphate isomerase
MSGGSGSRLWPISRISDPKPFLKLNNGESLLQATFKRSINLNNVSRILTITNEKLHFRMQDEYNSINTSIDNIQCDFILEPFGKNTAAAVINAVLFAKENNLLHEPLLIMPADHLINNLDNFQIAVNKALSIANLDYIVTFGITPNYPETGYGYIELDSNNKISDGFKVKTFKEKPNLETAKQYLQDGTYLWNAGIFCGLASTFLTELNLFAPTLMKDVTECFNLSKKDTLQNSKIIHLNKSLLQNIENISIDYALLEKSKKIAVVPCDVGWSDIGSWLSIDSNLSKDNNNNAIIGESILHNTKNSLIYSTNRIVAGVDLDNMVIVDTPDALLVANKNSSQEVKIIFERLKNMQHKTHENHETAHRPWGTYTVLEEGPFYKIKRIEVKANSLLSLQSHEYRSEHWIVVDGIATVTNGENTFDLNVNESTFIPVKTKHRLANNTAENLVIIEIQCGSYLGEDDIKRFEDVYGRG